MQISVCHRRIATYDYPLLVGDGAIPHPHLQYIIIPAYARGVCQREYTKLKFN